MRSARQILLLILLLTMVAALPASAQKNELSIGIGGYFPVNLTGVSTTAAIEGGFAHRIASVPAISAYLELPVVGTLNSHVRTFGLTSSASYSALFIAPGLKVKLTPEFFISPWIAGGVGLAHFSGNTGLRLLGGTNGSSNSAVVDFGGGLDLKVAPFFGVRGELRDFYSGGLGFNLVTFSQRQHNIVATAGLVFRF